MRQLGAVVIAVACMALTALLWFGVTHQHAPPGRPAAVPSQSWQGPASGGGHHQHMLPHHGGGRRGGGGGQQQNQNSNDSQQQPDRGSLIRDFPGSD